MPVQVLDGTGICDTNLVSPKKEQLCDVVRCGKRRARSFLEMVTRVRSGICAAARCAVEFVFDVACTHPLNGYRLPSGKVVVKQGKGNVAAENVTVGCGQCKGCRLRKAQDFAIRCMHERQTAGKASFITLTYADDYLPRDLSIDVEVWKLFAKRLRKLIGPFRFMACGEYGSQEYTARPHYHAIIFGHDFREDRVLLKDDNGYNLYRSRQLEKAWPFGHSSIGEVTFESAAYVARYTMKKQGAKRRKRVPGTDSYMWRDNDRYDRVDTDTGVVWAVKPEFAAHSKGYGLGKDWFFRYWRDVYPHDFVVVDGRKLRPPKFYDLLAESLRSVDIDGIKKKRREAVNQEISAAELEAIEVNFEKKLELRQ